MPACHTSRRSARPFVIAPYVEGEGGILLAKLPAQGPCRELDEAPCRLSLDHHRHRKTGPEIPLAVLRCRSHGRQSFTVYPPGYVPYGRQRIAPVALDGSLVHAEGKGDARAWAPTAFAAATDATRGRAWARDGRGPWWSVQGRWLARLVRLVGVAVELDDGVRATLAALLGVAHLVLREQSQRIAAGAGYRRRGQAITRVLAQMGLAAHVADRLVAAGAEVGLWPRALRWHPDVAQLRAVPFRARPARSRPDD